MIWILLVGVAADVSKLVDSRVNDGFDSAVGIILNVGVPAAIIRLAHRHHRGIGEHQHEVRRERRVGVVQVAVHQSSVRPESHAVADVSMINAGERVSRVRFGADEINPILAVIAKFVVARVVARARITSVQFSIVCPGTAFIGRKQQVHALDVQ